MNTTWDDINEMIQLRMYAIFDNKYANLVDEALYLTLDIRAKLEGK